MQNLTVIIISFNEAFHMPTVLKNVVGWAKYVVLLDSGSTDKTIEIAKSFGVEVFHRDFDNYSRQRNYAFQELPIQTEWILFLDADEYLTTELKNEISKELQDPKFDGYFLKRRFYFMGQWIKWGGSYPVWLLRLFKKSKGVYNRDVNEHLSLKGSTSKLKYDFVDDNRKPLKHWLQKHVNYAYREAIIYLENKDNIMAINFWESQANKKLWIRQYVWNNMPLFVRPFIFFLYVYFFRLGFMNGFKGLLYHFLHGFIYIMLIDLIAFDLKRKKTYNE